MNPSCNQVLKEEKEVICENKPVIKYTLENPSQNLEYKLKISYIINEPTAPPHLFGGIFSSFGVEKNTNIKYYNYLEYLMKEEKQKQTIKTNQNVIKKNSNQKNINNQKNNYLNKVYKHFNNINLNNNNNNNNNINNGHNRTTTTTTTTTVTTTLLEQKNINFI
ncbi:hypothetical protein DICPUDRAFT_97647 [Dictyostelium purpureum]|uniref:Uncharacterized protein n=1 Tax=Dictyostelium purpureum TaxID=5786 RepID=F0ZIJ4_DICPU|nr:uncharacterized protein DICPUDRAFT_97647 [Dictyostelium purpureum]EGC36235.1 hypothetical protein DICPUDRAFT_97647 [Dictyostelium purpureum]|eukprot:XP_003287244.1 hypothetical protein DICPUDRAFT_97647 [Dictyostelium purpureum]